MDRNQLRDFLKSLSDGEKELLAQRCDTSVGHLRNISYGKPCAPALAVSLEQESQQAVRRWHLRPADWHRIWPELATAPDAPPQPEDHREAA